MPILIQILATLFFIGFPSYFLWKEQEESGKSFQKISGGTFQQVSGSSFFASIFKMIFFFCLIVGCGIALISTWIMAGVINI